MASVGRLVKERMAQACVEELTQHPSFLVTSILKLPASEANLLRRRLSESRGRLFMVKRRLGLRAASELKVAGLESLFQGSVGLVLAGDDVLPAAKTVVEFIKEHGAQIALRGGLVDGQLLDVMRVEELASLPPKPVLLAQVLGTIEAPIADVIFTLERLIGDLAWLAEEAAKTKPAAAAPADVPAKTPGAADVTTTAPTTETAAPPGEPQQEETKE